MFTGIVERTGQIVALHQSSASSLGITRLLVYTGPGFATQLGDSVAVNGACLTVTDNAREQLAFDLSHETLAKTSLSQLSKGSIVNLERALQIGDRLGGHLVSGHIDGVGTITSVNRSTDAGDAWDLEVSMPLSLGRYLIPKGSIAVDGVSLTVNDLVDSDKSTTVRLTLIPTTINMTTFKMLQQNQVVNVEVDPIAKYVERLAKFNMQDFANKPR